MTCYKPHWNLPSFSTLIELMIRGRDTARRQLGTDPNKKTKQD